MSDEHLRFAFVECFCVCSGISIFIFFLLMLLLPYKEAHTHIAKSLMPFALWRMEKWYGNGNPSFFIELKVIIFRRLTTNNEQLIWSFEFSLLFSHKMHFNFILYFEWIIQWIWTCYPYSCYWNNISVKKTILHSIATTWATEQNQYTTAHSQSSGSIWNSRTVNLPFKFNSFRCRVWPPLNCVTAFEFIFRQNRHPFCFGSRLIIITISSFSFPFPISHCAFRKSLQFIKKYLSSNEQVVASQTFIRKVKQIQLLNNLFQFHQFSRFLFFLGRKKSYSLTSMVQ